IKPRETVGVIPPPVDHYPDVPVAIVRPSDISRPNPAMVDAPDELSAVRAIVQQLPQPILR
ncbi:hypothetical protein ACO2WH_24860, partial [Escherichia coli]|uniref:hypothetical protein n=1 Tax=Escherichia coli TaxID=562 RepID=UPI003C0147EC